MAGVSALLTLSSLDVGWVADDLWHRSVLRGSPLLSELGILKSGSIMDLFTFLDGDPQRNHRLMDLGILPWWTDPAIRGAFLRPVTALTHWLDYRLWPDTVWLMHLHSIGWLAATAGVVALLYRRLMGWVPAAGLAALLFAIDDAHGMPVGFLANRNALVAAFFGVLALIAHDRWRREGLRLTAIAGPLLLVISLLSAEAGIGIVAYLIAYALFLDRARWLHRALSLVPYLFVVVVWRVTWRALGYGVSANMEFYVDPLVDPLRFAWFTIERAPALLWGQWLTGAEAGLLLSGLAYVAFWAVAAAFLACIGWALAGLIRRDATARFWAVGSLLAVIPACSTIPSDRMLLYVSLGAFALLAKLLTGDLPNTSRSQRLLRRVLVVVHLVLAPILLVVRAAHPVGPRSFVERIQDVVPDDVSLEGRDVFVINPPIAMSVGFTPVLRAEKGLPGPNHIRVLGPSWTEVEVLPHDDFTLSVRPAGGYLRFPFDRLFRGDRNPLALGQRIELSGVTIEIAALTPDGCPAEALFRFDEPLDSPGRLWLEWNGGGYAPCSIP